MQKFIVGFVIGAILGGLTGYLVLQNSPWREQMESNMGDGSELQKENNNGSMTDENSPIADLGYLCEDEKTIHAVYFQNKVIVELSDGRAAQLPQVEAASGAKYSSEDESIIFWSKGKDAFVEEKGDKTYVNCVELDTSGVEVEAGI